MVSDEYRAIDAVNWSTLKRMRTSARHYKHGLAAPPEDSDPMRLGRAVHTAIFEPDKFAGQYAIWEGPRRAGKEWTAFEVAAGERTILTLEQAQSVNRTCGAVKSSPLARVYLDRQGMPEHTVQWTDPDTGIPCKCRIDWLTDADVVDLKTSRYAADPHAFARDAFQRGYFHQLAFYKRGLAEARLAEVKGLPIGAVIIAVEPTQPHDVAVYRLGARALEAADVEIDEMLTALKVCRDTDNWPGRFSAEAELDWPKWAYPSLDDIDLSDPDWMK